MKHVVGAAIAKGLAYLDGAQETDGSYTSDSSSSRTPFKPSRQYKTTFTPALILAALADTPEAMTIRNKVAAWLLAQKNARWSFNYWAVDAPERQTLPYPDDLDDTFCTLIALRNHDPSLIPEAGLANIVRLLLAVETEVGGPYRTWLVPQSAAKVWQDVDLAVNANIACFLQNIAEPLPNLTELMERAIRTHTFKSPYYPSPFPIVYYLARAYDGPLRHELAGFLSKRQREGHWGNTLQTALAISSLCRLGEKGRCDEAVTWLLAQQNESGAWPAEAFCLDPRRDGVVHYSGAAALTTALAIEALSLFGKETTVQAKPRASTDSAASKHIYSLARAELQTLQKPAQTDALSMLQNMQDNPHTAEIIMLPRLFNDSLRKPLTKEQSPLDQLGLANLFGWMAYTLYDDFLDDEGEMKLLPVANIALRASLLHFQMALPDYAAFQKLVCATFDRIDTANAWELAHCRFKVENDSLHISRLPTFSPQLILSERSLGHALTPLGVLAASGVPPSSPEAKHILTALQHYLVARQLNDDLHDWEQDCRRGQITYVVTAILRELKLPAGKQPLTTLIPKMQKQLWHHTLSGICDTITRHTALARKHADLSGLLKKQSVIHKLADRTDAAVRHTLEEQAKAQDFLHAYGKHMKNIS